jgi:hypothetical protein
MDAPKVLRLDCAKGFEVVCIYGQFNYAFTAFCFVNQQNSPVMPGFSFCQFYFLLKFHVKACFGFQMGGDVGYQASS